MGVAVAGERTWLFSGVAVVAPSPGIIAGRVSGHLGVPQRQRKLGGGALFGRWFGLRNGFTPSNCSPGSSALTACYLDP